MRGKEGEVRAERGNRYICWICVEHRYALGKQFVLGHLTAFAGAELNIKKAKGSTSVENATSDGEG